MVFDLETTGLPRMTKARKFANFKYTKYYDSSRIVSMSWVQLDKNMKHMSSNYYIIKPERFEIPMESTRIHGITTKEAMDYGVSLQEVLTIMNKQLKECDCLVAHNIRFDKSVLLSELYRHRMNDMITHVLEKNEFCTMMHGMKYLKTNRYPKLKDLYKSLYGNDTQNEHNAYFDALYACECFIKLNDTSYLNPSAN